MFPRPQAPPDPSKGFPPDALVLVIPRALLDRLLTLAILLAIGGTVHVTSHTFNMSVSGVSIQPK
jgi:hypothetical protein